MHRSNLVDLDVLAIVSSLKLPRKELFNSMKTAVRIAGHPCNCDQLTNIAVISKICFAKQMTLACPKSSFVLTVFNSLQYSLFSWGRCRALWYLRSRRENTFQAVFSS